MVLAISVLVKMKLNDIFQLQRLTRDWMLSELLDVWYDVGDIIHSSICCTCLQRLSFRQYGQTIASLRGQAAASMMQ